MSDSTRLISGPLQTERMHDGRRRLLRDLVVQVAGEPEPIRIRIPRGFETDYSSIPWLARLLFHWSRVDVAGVVHDWLYFTGEMSRTRADMIWRLVAVAGDHHANAVQGWAGWLGLRLGGWFAWDQHRRRRTIGPAAT